MKMKLKDIEIEEEICKFHSEILKKVIELIEVNEYELMKTNYSQDFKDGGMMFGEVIINQLDEEIERINKEFMEKL